MIKKIYHICIDFLANHSKLAFILSHGGIHLLVLFILFLTAAFLFHLTSTNEESNVYHIKIDMHQRSDSIDMLGYIRSMHYGVNAVYGTIDLDNANDEWDSISLDFKFVRGACLDIENIDYLDFDDGNLNWHINETQHEKEDTFDIGLSIHQGYGKADEPLSKNFNIYYEEYDNSHSNYKYIYHENTTEMCNWIIPVNLALRKDKKKKSATTILFCELNIDTLIGGNSDYYESFYMPFQVAHGIGEPILEHPSLRINFGNTDISSKSNNYKPFEIKSVFPAPDKITLSGIEYNNGNTILKIIRNGGIYVVYEDILAQNKASRVSMQFTVLVGAIIAFMLDIIVNLILKWRRLAKSHRQSFHNRINTRKRKKRI